MSRLFVVLMTATFMLGCNQGDERLAEKARIEGKESAKAELQAQLDAKDQLVEKAREEGKATAEAELKVQLDNIEKLKEKARAEGRAQAEEELQVQQEHIEQLIARARAEGRATAEEEIISQNENLRRRSDEMERDLATRHRFYQAVAGTYEGNLETETGKYKVRLKVVPSISPYPVNRVRLPEEIASDINNLHFNVQVVEWNPANHLSGVGCRIEGLRPNLAQGEMTITKETCPSLYGLKLWDESVVLPEEMGKPEMDSEWSNRVAEQILTGKLKQVMEIRGEKQPTTNASIYSFRAKRVKK